MKKLLLLSLCILQGYTYAQIGVNTSDITSTLTVNGSFSANYKEISSSNYQIAEDDYNLAFNGEGSGEAVFMLPKTETDKKKFIGRTYHIKNVSKNATVKVIASSSETIRLGGVYDDTRSIVLLPGRSISVIANSNLNGATWDLNLLGLIEGSPEVKATEFIKKIVPMVPGSAFNKNNEADQINIYNLTLGIQKPFNTNIVDIDFKLKNNKSAIYWKKSHFYNGTGAQINGVFTKKNADTWDANSYILRFSVTSSSSIVDYNTYEILIMGFDTNEIYRVTLFFMPKNSVFNDYKNPRATFFVEVLN
ncbi:hypothetical protein [Myroides odoratus]|uniref:Uncharacterized protein n=1 Tax=Myroides odoratus TaxID=256 RepID=A0A9Q6ZF34_MYROD|nr:hypothetical protein [Myroides odoratus]EHQ44255.1 hypothetical protein Myrod_3452 [Myroides odoratus DSM 2801]EKB05850.1 hypothetical protein HMPREF9716_02643 [Myroides odoratus CIP 103059]QQU01536.1 hypothetical protein I6I88_07295 [Myroides odoratus]WQD56194.1 hypothetical protein U0010_11715 [Myroides odoratus]STZ31592.1 Uncharacterised protein [Myroides odoratus]